MSSQSRDISESRPLIAVLLIASMLTIMLDTVLSPALPGLRENFSNVENIDFLARIILTFPRSSLPSVRLFTASSSIELDGRESSILRRSSMGSVAVLGTFSNRSRSY